ncbi:hypothetical protein FX985_00958 [Pseudomonas extremaustralis]|uniref:Glycosyltransferase RgtA/B/C/D-like domain-containing protein n=1 Tax=Pseudomonas extremaustralis TaxID=359110 RepID=A0A5M9IVU6_9PSED|nr:glycosyltransferase family 39 protein [Pseudomonas extremaustralis]KAA8560908.1 hypothetical protein FX985_00958 [Pseudomonas extremaustralis]
MSLEKSLSSLERARNLPFWLMIVGLAVALRLYNLTGVAVWSDEAFSLSFVTYSYSDIWRLSAADVHPPLYHLILRAVMQGVGSDSLVWMRGFSAVIGVLNVIMGMVLARMIATRRASLIAGLLLAMLPIAVRYSQDVRMYALMGLLLTAATIALVCWVRDSARIGYLVIYVLLMVAGLYTHYFAVFCALSHWLYIAFLQFRKPGVNSYILAPAWWLANIAIVLLFAPWLPSLIYQAHNTWAVGWIPEVTKYSVPSSIWRFFTLDDAKDYQGVVYWMLPTVCWISALAVFFNDKSRRSSQALAAMCFFVPVLGCFLISFVKPLFVERYLFFSAVMLVVVMAVAVDKIKNTVLLVVSIMLFLTVEVVGLVHLYWGETTMNNPSKPEVNKIDELMLEYEWGRISGDAMIAYDLYIFYAAIYYDKGKSRILLYTPPTLDGQSGRPDGYGFSMPMNKYPESTYVDSLEGFTTPARRVWRIANFAQAQRSAISFPHNWRFIYQTRKGDQILELYVICEANPITDFEVCE